MGNTSKNMEDSGAECDLMNYGDQEISEKYVNMWPRQWSYDILMLLLLSKGSA